MVGVGAHCGEIDVNLAVAVGIVALHLPGVGDAVTVDVGVVGVGCWGGDRAQAEDRQGGKRETRALPERP